MVHADGKLVGVGDDLGGGCVGVCSECALSVVRERVAGEDFGDGRVDGDGEGVAGDAVVSIPLRCWAVGTAKTWVVPRTWRKPWYSTK